MLSAWHDSSQGNPRLLLLEGAAGIGKSHTLRSLTAQTKTAMTLHQSCTGWLTGVLRSCHTALEAERDPGFLEAARRVTPELRWAQAGPVVAWTGPAQTWAVPGRQSRPARGRTSRPGGRSHAHRARGQPDPDLGTDRRPSGCRSRCAPGARGLGCRSHLDGSGVTANEVVAVETAGKPAREPAERTMLRTLGRSASNAMAKPAPGVPQTPVNSWRTCSCARMARAFPKPD
jgi:hypothetical protein